MPRSFPVFCRALCALLLTAGALHAHDMFLRPASFFVAANSTVLVRLLNGTFSRSENSITRDRLIDVAIVSPDGRTALDTARWSVDGDTSTFTLATGAAGTYVIGTSTRPRMLALSGREFNRYLADDGIPDELAARRRERRLEEASRERYAKHVKALIQVGGPLDSTHKTVLGYPVEIVPLENPYALRVGSSLRVRVTADGAPLARQYVQFGGRTAAGARVPQQATRSDRDGVATIPLPRAGSYYVKFIQMRRLEGDVEANYESRWATLTFAIR
jgi:uncharacterized GH25 family protein